MEDEEDKFRLEGIGLCNIYFIRKYRFSFVYASKRITTSLQDAQYFSDSEHQMNSGGWAQYRGSLGGGGAGNQGDMHRRMRNRTLTGLESMRGMGGMDHLRPASAQGRPITPSFSNEKDPGQTFIDFNPAGT